VKYSGGGCTQVSGRRSGQGCWQGGRGSSQRRCGARGGVGEFRGGPGRRFAVTQRWQARWCSGDEGAEEEKGSLHGGCSFYSRWRRLAKAVRAVGGAVVAVKPGHGKAVAAAVRMQSARVAPLFGQGG
jgi:hypothetical protein